MENQIVRNLTKWVGHSAEVRFSGESRVLAEGSLRYFPRRENLERGRYSVGGVPINPDYVQRVTIGEDGIKMIFLNSSLSGREEKE